MAHVNPTWPNSGDHGWATQMNSNLDSLVSLENLHDDMLSVLINGIDGGNASTVFNGTVNFDGGGAAG